MFQKIHLAVLPLIFPLLGACRPASPLQQISTSPAIPEKTSPALPSVSNPPSEKEASPIPSFLPAASPKMARKSIRGIDFEGVSFDSRGHHLIVIDQDQGPASRYLTAREAAESVTALLALNASFFTPEGDPLGLVIASGKRKGAWNSSSSLGSGVFAESASGHLLLARRSSAASFAHSKQLIQAGPLLVERGKIVHGLETQKKALRSILLHDGGHRWWIGISSLCTLAEISEALAYASPADWPIKMALNLDGGLSTDLYVSAEIPGGNFQRRSFFNRPVRNFLALKAR